MAEGDGLRVEDLGVERGGRLILAGLTFRVAPGEALAVMGPNGTGKSTLLRALAGLLPASAGRVAFAAGSDRGIAGSTHYLGHSDGLKRALTALGNLDFARAWAGPTGTMAEAALQRLGIGHLADLPVAYLSAGQRRRVALARLLVSRRPLWLVDEPTTALDTAGEALLAEIFRVHLADGGLIVAATHAPLAVPARALRLGMA